VDRNKTKETGISMRSVSINEVAGSFAESKDIARRIRDEILFPALKENERVIIDFAEIESVTQSFIHVMISEPIRRYGGGVLDNITFKNCNENVRKMIMIVSDYMQESES
jgi:hypothetical protein